jgi:hypothetical protein
VEGLAALDSAVRDQRFRYVSPGIVTVADPEPAEALLVRDPDGHAAHIRRRLQ